MKTFKSQDDLLREFQEKMGVQLKWQALLTKEQTYLISVRRYSSSFGNLDFLGKKIE